MHWNAIKGLLSKSKLYMLHNPIIVLHFQFEILQAKCFTSLSTQTFQYVTVECLVYFDGKKKPQPNLNSGCNSREKEMVRAFVLEQTLQH